MRQLMAEALRVIEEGDYEVSFLTGQRQRYAYWGWEKAGVSVRAAIVRENLRHHFGNDAPPREITLSPVEVASETPAGLKGLHDRLAIHAERRGADFGRSLTHWGAATYVARDEAGGVCGYAVVAEDGREVSELAARDVGTAVRLVRALVAKKGEVEVDIGPGGGELGSVLGEFAENMRVRDVYNWKVLYWRRTLEVLLRHRCEIGPVAPGSVVLEIEGVARRMRMSVESGEARVDWCDEASGLGMEEKTATRVLFGPVRPSHVIALPREAAVLDAWCPLPLWLGRQDHV